MRLTAGSKVAKTRSQRTVISAERVKLARAVAPAEVIALESADDPEGFSFWLALAEGPAFVHTGPKKTENGRSLVPGGYYITVRYYERFPPSSSSAFKLSDTKWTENAEGVIANGSCSACPRCITAPGPGLLIETHRSKPTDIHHAQQRRANSIA